MTYRAPVADMLFAMRHVAGLDRLIADGLAPGLEDDMSAAILEEAAKFAGERLAPLNRVGDQHGAVLKDGKVMTAPGFREAYRDWAAGGWNALTGPEEFGGQGLPMLIATACGEMWNSACMAFSLGPLAHLRGDRSARGAWLEGAQGRLSREARLGRVDGDHEPHRAAGRLRPLGAPDQGGAGGRRHLPDHRAEDLHHLWRARPDRQHHPPGAGAAARRAARHARHLALPRAEIPRPARRLAGRARTTCAATRSSTSSASTPRRPAPWSSATRAAPWASSSARRIEASPACSR